MRSEVSWRDTAIAPKLVGKVDARVAVFLLIYGMHMSWPTFYLAVGAMFFSVVLVYLNQTPTSLWRWLAQKITGARMHSGVSNWILLRSMRY